MDEVYELIWEDLTQLGGPMGVHYDIPQKSLGLFASQDAAKKAGQDTYTNSGHGKPRDETLFWKPSHLEGQIDTGDMVFCKLIIRPRRIQR